jgi:hypothetical protein
LRKKIIEWLGGLSKEAFCDMMENLERELDETKFILQLSQADLASERRFNEAAESMLMMIQNTVRHFKTRDEINAIKKTQD